MKKIKILIVCFLTLVSCKSVQTVYKKEKVQDIDQLGYVTPLYEYNKSSKGIKSFEKFEKYTNKKVDSLFLVEAKNYKISKKVSSTESHSIDIENIFNALRNNQKVNFTSNFKSLLQDSKEKYMMFIVFTPKLRYLHGLIPIISTSKMEALIIETQTEDIIFYDRVNSSKRNSTKRVLDNFKKIYIKLNNL